MDDAADVPPGSPGRPAADIPPAGDTGPNRAAAGLDRWRRELDDAYRGRPRHPILRRLAPEIARYGLKREYFDLVMEGIAMDLAGRRYATIGELAGYFDRVAGAVGLLCLQIFGLHDDPRAREYSRNLSYALQMTNVIRDMGNDARAGRFYVPEEDLSASGYSLESLKAGRADSSFYALGHMEARRAREWFEAARRSLTGDAKLRRRLAGAEVMRATYEALLARLDRALDLALDPVPVRLSLLEKVMTGLAAYAEARWQVGT